VAFSYENLEYCSLDGIVSPTISVLGGTFSANSDLSIDENSGAIDLTNVLQGLYEITYLKTNEFCSIDSTVNLFVYQYEGSEAGDNQILSDGLGTELNAVNNINGTGTWIALTDGPIINDVNFYNSTVSKLEVGNNTFTWQIENGTCPISIDSVLIYIEDFLIPQALTPNNDGLNDMFIVKSLVDKENKIQVFNRWGEIIFTSTNNDSYWDGTNLKGNELPDDTYFYVIETEEEVFKGFVMLKR
jgi:gliding motility-associated-like protein